MPCVKRKWGTALVIAFLLLFPSAGFAADSCVCFCGEAKEGAIPVGRMEQSECGQTCKDNDAMFVGCFTEESQYPYNNDKCWTESECSAFSEEVRRGMSTETVRGTWGSEMPYNCSRTKSTGEEMRYCYANDVKYNLLVPIGGESNVENLPDYINTAYTWILPAATLAAVVLMMIGGLQYVLSRGKEKYISKGKQRITNAITGIVLLMAVYVILYLIDPRLTMMNSLKIPLVKKVVIVDANSSCERLGDVGYDIKPTPPTAPRACGSVGTVEGLPPEGNASVGTWKIGESCQYYKCDLNKTCVTESTSLRGDVTECRSCFDIPVASEATCKQAERLEGGSDGTTQVYCRFDSALSSCVTAGTDLGTTASSPQGFYCNTLQTWAKDKVDGKIRGCDVYNELDFGYKGSVGDINTAEGSGLLQTICNTDPCGIAAWVGATRCNYNEGATAEGTLWVTTTNTYTCNTF